MPSSLLVTRTLCPPRKFVRKFSFLVFFLLLCAAPLLQAQSTFGTILGTVHDGSGAVIPGATVTLVKTYPVGNGPRSIVINSDSTYLYVGNDTDSTISGYSIGTNAALTALAGSPYAAPSSVDALAIDSTGKYVIASGYNASSGIQLYTIGSAGALTPTASAGDGTAGVPSAIAATH